ncbi:MAG: restriction endonuclease, partial [Bacteroidales bacterium]
MKKYNSKEILIQKASGERELFDVSKLKQSLKNAGAKDEVIAGIADDIQQWIYEGATTRRIYERAYQLLRFRKQPGALRYRLKKALFSMGPSGYPFEHFIGELFRQMGFDVQVGVVVEGVTITHEIDVIATKGRMQHLMECKYTHDQGNRLNVQVPLYVHSRVDDIVEKRHQETKYRDFTFSAWVVTNGRFSSDSEAYSRSKKIQLLGWDYPNGKGLKDLIEKENVYPVTILKSLGKKEQQQLMESGIVTCNQLLDHSGILSTLLLSD